MSRIWLLALIVLFSCGSKDKKPAGEELSAPLQQYFQQQKAPYSLADTSLLRLKDTASLDPQIMSGFISDSLVKSSLGSGKVSWHPLKKISGPKQSYYIVRGNSSSKSAAFLLVFADEAKAPAVLPFLVPDSDPYTSQVSSVEKSFSIAQSTVIEKPETGGADSKTVYDYNAEGNKFIVIMMDMAKGPVEVINPIDTFPATHALSGNYVKDAKNFISIRDGRSANQLSFFIHFENENDCSGELRGDLLVTTPTTAIFRTGGDPCVLSMQFKNNTVTVHEDEGCGSHRGPTCLFDGRYARKKAKK